MDNASNNSTFMSYLEAELKKQGIPFNRKERQIR